MVSKKDQSSLLPIIENDLPNLSKAFNRIARFILDTPELFMHKTIGELSTIVEVSEPTLIRFCRKFDYDGVPDFRIALAISLASLNEFNDKMQLEPNITKRSYINKKCKQAIAVKAREFVSAGDSIIIDSGSTMSIFAETLVTAPPLTIMTTGLNVMNALWHAKQHKIMLPGGVVNSDLSSLTGRMVENAFEDKYFDIIFLAASSVLSETGLSTFSEEEAHQNKMMIKAAKKVILLADSSKFIQPALHKICDVSRIFAVVTDKDISPENSAMLIEHGVKVIIAD